MTGDTLKSRFLAPSSVAFVGVPRNSGPGSFNPVDNLMKWGYGGRIQLVHPHVREIAGLPAVKDVSHLEGRVDLAVISTPRETVPGIVRKCVDKGVRAIVVTNQGFSEADEQGGALQRAMVDEARKGGARLLGPNTLGVSNAFDRFTCSFMPLEREEAPIGVICQSGIFFVGARYLSGGMGIGVDVGNGCDLDPADCLAWFESDTRIRVVAIHAEGIPRGRAFLDAASRVSERVPVVVLKTGRSPEGARAASTHSGSLVGEDLVVDAAMKASGVLRVQETQELADLVRGFIRLPPMRGSRLAVVTLTGAGGIIILDAMSAQGLIPSGIGDATLQGLRELSPPWMPLGNPMDIWPALMKHGMRRVYSMALRDALTDPDVDGVLCVALGLPQEQRAHLDVVDVIQDASEESEKPIVAWFYGPRAMETAERLEERGRALGVQSPERAVRTLSRMARYWRWRKGL